MPRVVLGRVPVLHPYSRYYSDGWAAQKFHEDRDIPASAHAPPADVGVDSNP